MYKIPFYRHEQVLAPPRRPYRGVTYPKVFSYRWVQCLWKKYLCPKDMHLLDEVMSMDSHYLVCDACDLEIHIERFNTEYMETQNAKSAN